MELHDFVTEGVLVERPLDALAAVADIAGVHPQQVEVVAVVGLFGAEGHRAAAEGDLVHIRSDGGIGGEHPHLHGQVEGDHIALMPFAGEVGIAVLIDGHLLPAGDDRVLGPGGDAEGEGGVHSLVAVEGNIHMPVPGHAGLDLHGELPAMEILLHRAAHVQVGEEGVLVLGVGVGGDGSDDAGDVGRAAGAAEPLAAGGLNMSQALIAAAGLRHDGQRVDVEEALAVQRHAGQHGVVQRHFHHIGVLAVGLHLKHPAGEEGQADGGAGFGIGGVIGQVIGVGEGFAVVGGADAAGDVELLVHDVVPQPVAGRQEGIILGQPCHVRHAGIQVHRAHRMTHGLVLLADGLPRLVIIRVGGGFRPPAPFLFGAEAFFLDEIVRRLTALIHEVFAQAQILLLAGHLVQPHQRHLGDIVARVALALAVLRAQTLVDEIHEPACRPEQLILARGLVIGHRALHQMAQAVQLVVVAQVGQRGVHAVDDVIGVQIAIGVLGGADDVDGFVRDFFQLRVGMLGQTVTDGLDPLGEVRILEEEAVELVILGMGHVLGQGLEAAVGVLGRRVLGAQTALIRHHPPGHAEIAHAPGRIGPGNAVIQRFPLVGNHLGAHQLHLAVPEGIGDGDFLQVDGRRKQLPVHLHASEGGRRPIFQIHPISGNAGEAGRSSADAAGGARRLSRRLQSGRASRPMPPG